MVAALEVWCVVWCGVVWCGVVWCGVVWCGVLATLVGVHLKRQQPSDARWPKRS